MTDKPLTWRPRKILAHPADKIEYARLLRGQGRSYGEISAKTSIPKASLHRYLTSSGGPA